MIYLWLSALLLNTSLQVMHKRKETKDKAIAKTDIGGRKAREPSERVLVDSADYKDYHL